MRPWLAVVLASVLFFAGCAGVDPTPRELYRPHDFDNDPWLSSFNDAYADLSDEARRDPMRVAGLLANIGSGEARTFGNGSDRLTVIATVDPVREDDSIASEQTRIDLRRVGDRWEIEWAGGRWKCVRGRGQIDWARALCK